MIHNIQTMPSIQSFNPAKLYYRGSFLCHANTSFPRSLASHNNHNPYTSLQTTNRLHHKFTRRKPLLDSLVAGSSPPSFSFPPPPPHDDIDSIKDSSPTQSSDLSDDSTQLELDLQLPRRSMLVTFTCNICNSRTERHVNPLAWNTGLVIVQCQQCKAWHKVADSGGLIEEIKFTSDDE